MNKKRVVLYFVLVIISFFYNFYFRPTDGNPLVNEKYKKSNAYVNNIYNSDEFFKEKLLDDDSYEIYKRIINASLNNDSTVTIRCVDRCNFDIQSIYHAIYLDHPELISYEDMRYIITDDKVVFKNNSNLNKLQIYFGTRRIERELDNIRKDTKNMTDKEKIIYVYNYVASHNYDRVFTYSGSNQSAYSFFTKGSSVCAGFAKASQIIFQNIGIKSYLVLGYEHMWNYVEYDGKYYVFDSTVGASYTDKSYKKYYDGLGRTTVDKNIGLYEKIYPEIETTKLKELFDL